MREGKEQADDLELAAFVRGATNRIRMALLKRGLRGAGLDDCTQEVLIEVIERWAKLRSYPSARRNAYVGAVCRGTAVDWLRRTRSSHNLFVHADAEPEPDPWQSSNPEREYAGSRARHALESCLADCDSATKTTFVLVCLAGHTEAEAASVLGIPLGTVASRLRRVRSRLRKELGAK